MDGPGVEPRSAVTDLCGQPEELLVRHRAIVCDETAFIRSLCGDLVTRAGLELVGEAEWP